MIAHNKNMALYSFGEILYDVYPERKCIGGAPLNFAAHFALQGNETYMISAVGDDENGRDALEWMQGKNVRTDYVKTSLLPTGACLVTLDDTGLPSYDLQTDVAWDDIDAFKVVDVDGNICADGAVLYFGSLALRSDYNLASLRAILANNSFREIFVDINLRAPFYSNKVIRFALEHATILKVSGEELPLVTDALGIVNSFFYEKTLLQMTDIFPALKIILITLGENGSYAYDRENNLFYQCPAVPADVVSTVGAGDSFSATFLSEYLKSSDIDSCLAKASETAAFVCSKYDAVP
ncbi:MAG: PfkB family carbohydrate kinase [Lachnospiraceae bacterium]|nr:PfkB family carbohydrate kinase [Lachnospiraceae bacterium]